LAELLNLRDLQILYLPSLHKSHSRHGKPTSRATRPSTVRPAIDLSIARRRCSSTCRTLWFMPRPSTVRTAIDPSAARRRCNSTCGTLVFTNRIRRPLWISFSALSQRSIMTLLSHQLLRMPTCGDTKDGAVVVPRQTMRGTDTKTRCKANCTCGTVQRTI
jgi:hypothetical protein